MSYIAGDGATGDTENSLSSNRHIGNDQLSTTDQQQACGNNWSYAASTAALCLCHLLHAYLLISVFPYSGYMMIHLIDGVTPDTAGTYAGLLGSAFMAGRTLSAYQWGKVADTYGRKFVLYTSIVWSALLSLLFGTSQSFHTAMFWRFLLGFGNGIVSTTKTAATELAKGNAQREQQTMGLVIGMRGWGFLISPAVGGLLADPLKQYPSSRVVQRYEGLFSMFPFLLPNLVAAVMCGITFVAVFFFVEETLPQSKQRSTKNLWTDFCYNVRRFGILIVPAFREACASIQSLFSNRKQMDWDATGHAVEERRSLLVPPPNENKKTASEYEAIKINCEGGTIGSNFNSHDLMIDENDRKEDTPSASSDTATISSLWSRRNTRLHLSAYWLFSFVVVCVDEAFPLYCISPRGGMGLSEASIGKILSGAGLLFACCQYCIFAFVVNTWGLYRSLHIGSLLGVPPVVLLPLSLLMVPEQDNTTSNAYNKDELTGMAFSFLTILTAIMKIFSCLYFSSITIALNKTVPSHHRGTMNGLATFGGSIAKGLGPTFAGILVAMCFSSRVKARIGSVIVFGVIAILGLFVAGESFALKEEEVEEHNVDREENTRDRLNESSSPKALVA